MHMPRIALLFTSLALASLAAVPVWAQETAAGVTPSANLNANPWATGRGPVKGRVLDQGGRPVAGARVAWYAIPVNNAGPATPARFVAERKTKGDGSFLFADADKLARRGAPRIVVYTSSGIVSAKEGVIRPNANLVLAVERQSRLVLKFVDPSGKPAPRVDILATLQVPGTRQAWNLPLNDGRPLKTDANGTLVFANLPGARRVRLSVAGNSRYDLLPPANEVLVLRRPVTSPSPLRLSPRKRR